MYSIFNSLKEKPIITLGILVVLLLIVISITSSISSLSTVFGFNTSENTSIRLEKTNNELEKAVEVLENNEHKDMVKKEIDVITTEKVTQDAVVIDTIKADELKVLEQIKNTIVVDDVKDVVDIKPKTINMDRPTVVYVKKKLNNKQKLAISILRDRAKLLKGNRV